MNETVEHSASAPSVFPKQKISTAEKNADDGAFFKDTLNYLVEQCNILGGEKYEMMTLYNLLGTQIDVRDYKHIINPFNIKDDRYKRVPARLRNYNIIKPIIDLFLGERSQRYDAFRCISTPTDEGAYEKGLNQQLVAALAQDVVNQLNAAGVETGVDSKEIPELKELQKKYEDSYADNVSIFGQEALDYIIYDQDLDDKGQQLIVDYLVTGRVYTRKDVIHNDIEYEVLNPLFSYHPVLDVHEMVEDSQWFVYRHRKTPNEVVDWFRKDLSSDEVDSLDNAQSDTAFLNNYQTLWMASEIFDTTADHMGNPTIDGRNDGNASYYDHGKLDVWEGIWRGFKQIQILTYVDQLGQVQEMEVTADYTLIPELGDLKLEEEYISCVYRRYRIDLPNNVVIHIDKTELPVDRAELNNSSVTKLNVNGIANTNRTGEILSFVKASQPYQITTNILFFQAEKLINKLKSKLTTMPLSLFPNNHPDWTQDKFLWASEAIDMLVVDDSRKSAVASLNAIKSLDMGQHREIMQIFDTARNIKLDYWESFGMNRQRYGDVAQSAGKAVTEQATIRSATISEETFRRINKLLEKDYEGLIDYSKVAWIDGKKGNYLNSDGKVKWLQMNPDNVLNHISTDYRIFVKSNREEEEKMDFIRNQMLFSAAQNGLDPMVQFAMLNSNNPAQAERQVRVALDALEEKQEAIAEKEQQATKEVAQLEAESEQADRDIKKYDIDVTNNTLLKNTILEAELSKAKENSDIKLDWENLQVEWGKLELGREELKSKERIAKSNNAAKSKNSSNK